MKVWNILMVLALAVVFLTGFAFNVGAQDKKEAKTAVNQVLQKDKPNEGAKASQDKQTKTDCCKDHDPAKGEFCKKHDPGQCNHEKSDCCQQMGSKDQEKKPAAGDCKHQKASGCCGTDQTKKLTESKDKK